MESYIDEFGNLQFRNVGTNNEFPFVNISQFAEGVNQGKSIDQIIKENTIQKFNLGTNFGNTQSGFATNFPLQPVPVNTGITQSTVGQTFEPAFVMAGGQKFALNDPRIDEQRNYFTRPTGILTQAKDFVTQTLPNMIKGGINMIPGMRFIQSLDKFNTLPYQDRKFIKSAMDMKGIPNTGIYVDPRTGLIKDIRGKNVRSLMGNYAKSIQEDYSKLENRLEKSKANWTEKFGSLENTNKFGKTWAEMNKNNLNNFSFLQSMKNKFDQQKAALLEKIKNTKSINIHGGPTFKGPTAAELSRIGRDEYTGPGKAFEARSDTYTGGRTVDSPSTPGGKYSSPR